MTDFLAWWADHWPLIPLIAAYFAWEAYKWINSPFIAYEGNFVWGKRGLLGVFMSARSTVRLKRRRGS